MAWWNWNNSNGHSCSTMSVGGMQLFRTSFERIRLFPEPPSWLGVFLPYTRVTICGRYAGRCGNALV